MAQKNSPKTLCLISFLVVAFFSANLFAQSITKDDIVTAWQNLSNYSMAVAEKMPEESYDYTPVETLRNFRQQMHHIASLNNILSYYLIKDASKTFDSHFKALPEKPTKQETIADMKETSNRISGMIEGMTEKDFSTKETFFTGNEMTRHKMILFIMDHMTHTRGISIMYLRTKGIEPPPYNPSTTWK